VAFPRAAYKAVSYRSLRSLPLAAQVPSAGTSTLQMGLHSARVPISTRVRTITQAACGERPSHRKAKAMQVPSILHSNPLATLACGLGLILLATLYVRIIGF
jgi:hypothetical protein